MARKVSLDWPLSREEKRSCVMRLYEKDVQAANCILRTSKAELRELRQEVRVLRRNSHGSTATTTAGSSSPEQEDAPDKVTEDDSGDEEQRLPESLAESSYPALATADRRAQEQSADQAAIQFDVAAKTSTGSTLRSQSVGCSRSSPGKLRVDGQIMKDIACPTVKEAREEEAREGEDEAEEPPLTPEEAILHSALTQFYEKRRIEGKAALVMRITRRYAHSEAVPELWASIATKYTVPPAVAVQFLALTLGPFLPAQWCKDQVPESASRALSELAKARVAGGMDPAKDLNTFHTNALQLALDAGDIDAIRALSFKGCPSSNQRPQLWRALLSRPVRGGGCISPAALEERRAAYRQLRTRAVTVDNSEQMVAASPRKVNVRDPLRAEVEADARSCWRGEAFMQQTDVIDAIVAIALTTAVRYTRYIRGSCDVAALLLFALSGGCSEELAAAEADAFWCMVHLVNELQGPSSKDEHLEEKIQKIADSFTVKQMQVRRFHWLLRKYDPALAELLATHNLIALPATRVGVALCSRAGFKLEVCARLWDSLLADPQRFEMCDYAVLGLMLVTRGRLLQQRHDAGDLAEALLAAPHTVEPEALLRTMFAICAFERRCGPDSMVPYPPHPGVLDVIANSALDGLSRVHHLLGGVQHSLGGVRDRWKARRRSAAASTAQPAVQATAQQRGRPAARTPAALGQSGALQGVASCKPDGSHVAALEVGLI